MWSLVVVGGWVLGSIGLSLAGSLTRMNCDGLSVGVHAIPGFACSPHYVLCGLKGDAKQLTCPLGTFFDKSSRQCKDPAFVTHCNFLSNTFKPQPNHNPVRTFSVQDRKPKTSFPTRPSGRELQPIPITKNKLSASIQSPSSLGYGKERREGGATKKQSECEGKEDGDYSQGCSHLYISCRAGAAIRRTCALTTLKFDEELGRCDMDEVVRECGGQPRAKEEKETDEAEKLEAVEKDPRCEGLPSGIFPMPGEECSSSFLSCTGGFAQEMPCPAQTKFDVETGMCLGRIYVAACGGKPTPKPTTTPQPEATSELDPEIDCEGKIDGDFPIPGRQCAYGYVSCTGGVPKLRACPDGLFFDSLQGLCEEEKFNSDCGGSPREGGDESSTTTHAPFVKEEEFSCLRLQDGLYPDDSGCSSTFYACSGGEASKMVCSGGLAFDSQTERCLNEAYVEACGGSPTPIPKPPEEVEEGDGPAVTEPPIDFDCGEAGEGHHSLGCSKDFVVCSFGRPFAKTCASDGLRFDAATNLCLAPAFVEECDGVATPRIEETHSTTPSPSSSSASEAVFFDCTAEADGIYESGPCEASFFVCSSGVASLSPCPKGLIYDAVEKACVKEALIPACAPKVSPSLTAQRPHSKPLPRSLLQPGQGPVFPSFPAHSGHGKTQTFPASNNPKPGHPRPRPDSNIFRPTRLRYGQGSGFQ